MRKRKLALIMAAAMVFTACPSNGRICYAGEIMAEEPAFYATGNETSSEDFNYTISDGEVMIEAYIGNDTSVVIPSEIEGYPVTQIGRGAFRGCTGLTSITIPNGVRSIGDAAFSGCSGLTSITIPSSVTSIGGYAFGACSNLTSITVDSSNSTFSSIEGILFNKDITELIFYPTGKKETVYHVPVSVTSIGEEAFSGCSGLTSITIPNGVTSIGFSAFDGCSGLTSITIPDSVTSIGNYAFSDCSSLTSITIPGSVTSTGYSAFKDCSGLTNITIQNGVTSIDFYSFFGCSNLTSITIPNGVTSIGCSAFEDCSNLQSVILPNSVTDIDYDSFSGCSPKMIIFGYAGSFAEQYAKKNDITFKQIEDNTVMITPETLTIEEGESAALSLIVTLEQYTDEAVWVSTDDSIASVSQEGIVTGKTAGTAEICVTVGDVSASCRVTVIPKEEKTQQILEGTAEYHKVSGDAPFELDVVLKEGDGKLSYSSDNPAVAEVTPDGTVTVKVSGTAVITVTAAETEQYEASVFTVKIIVSEKVIDNPPADNPPVNNNPGNPSQPNPSPDAAGAVITAQEGVFKVTSAQKANPTVTFYSSADKNATVITVPTTIQKNGITYQVTAVEKNAFANLKKLKTVKIGANVTEIGANAFKGCRSLTKITIPASVTKIGNNAFKNCKNLKKLIIKSKKLTKKSLGKQAFKGLTKKTVVQVPKKKLKAYKKLLKQCGLSKSVKVKGK